MQAAELGMSAMALTDHDAVYGAVEFSAAAKEVGVRPIFGAELTLHDNSHLTLLVKNELGWSNLCQLITLARANAAKGASCLPEGSLESHTDGLIALSGCRQGAIAQSLLHNRYDDAIKRTRQLRDWFGVRNFWMELQNHHLPTDRWLNRALAAMGQRLNVGSVATNNVHYALAEQKRLQDVLVCIRHNSTLDASELLRRPNAHYRLKSAEAMHQLFPDQPQAIENTQRIAEQCDFDLSFGLQHLPQYPTPQRTPAIVYLYELCEQQLGKIRPKKPSDRPFTATA